MTRQGVTNMTLLVCFLSPPPALRVSDAFMTSGGFSFNELRYRLSSAPRHAAAGP